LYLTIPRLCSGFVWAIIRHEIPASVPFALWNLTNLMLLFFAQLPIQFVQVFHH
ncbi:unnamed protein product, partial [Musa acuminata subsp. malaccensis]